MHSIDIFPWDDHFNTGLPEIDAQHRRLVALLNQLASHTAFANDLSGLGDIFDQLADYTVYHFETEEAIWRQHLAGDPNEAGHRDSHAGFVDTVVRLRAELATQPAAHLAEQALGFLARWLASHILESDRRMAYAVLALRDGLTPEAAWQHADERMSGNTRSLIDIILAAYGALTANTLKLMREIAEHGHAEKALHQQRETLQLILDYAPIGIWLQDGNGKLTFVNKAFCQATGIPEERFLSAPHYAELIPEAFRAQCLASDAKALAGDGISETRQRLPFVDGRVHDLRVIKAVKRNAAGQPEALIGLSLDITDELARQHALRNSEERLRLAMDAARQAWFELDLRSGAIETSPEYPRMIGYEPETFDSNLPNWLGNIHPDDQAAVRDAFAACLDDGGPYTMDYRRRTRAGDWKWLRSIGKVTQRDEGGRATHMVGIHTDISQIKEHERQLERIAHYDALTGLPNRMLLSDRLRHAMVQAQRHGNRVAVVYIDLDGFKAVNDAHGHDVGDRLLTLLALRMKQALRDGDTLARLGGDEFVAVLLDLADPAGCLPILDRLLAAASEQTPVGNLTLRVSASLGVAFYPQTEEVDADQLLRQADQAMYQAKLAGKHRYAIFDVEQDRSQRGRHESLARIRLALTRGEFELHYQPKVNMRQGQVVGVEALIRWRHPERGLLPPGEFLPVIDEHYLSVEVGNWVLDTALAQVATWKAAGYRLPVSVNVDGIQLRQADFFDRLRGLLSRHGLDGDDLELEMVETSALDDLGQIIRVIEQCQSIGVGFALDDFGTGYSSLTYLRRLPARLLKIDQSFVRDMLDDPEDLAILEGVLSLANGFRREVIAEGVETEAHGEMLLRLGCELGQGYTIARPIPAGHLVDWLATWCPPATWLNLRLYDRNELPIYLASVEVRHWANQMIDHLKGTCGSLPPQNPQECRFGKWLEQTGGILRGSAANFMTVDLLHRELHARAEELLILKRHNLADEAEARCHEIEALGHSLVEHLQSLIS